MNSLDFNKKLHQARYFMQLNNHQEALKLYAELAGEFPLMSMLWDEYGRSAATAGDYDLAEQAWEKLLGLEPKNAELLLRLAGEYGKIWLFTKARELSHQAAELEPGNLNAQVNLASLLARTGGVDEARPVVERCLKLDSHCEQARYLAAHLDRRENKLEDAERQFRDLIAAGMREPEAKYLCRFELARILDRTERFDEAMAELAEGKRLAAQTINLAEAQKAFHDRRERILRKVKSLPKNILEVWSQSFPADVRAPAPAMAFLGGHARSGTTLLERILDAHPSVAACDEPLAFMTIIRLIDITLPELPTGGLNFLRQRYLKNFGKALPSPADGKLLLDKNPGMTPYLAAFLRAFPELRVLIALRDPRDVMISSYFEDLANVSHFSFENLALHYQCVMEVWLAIREWDGLAWMETRYEDIVTDMQKEAGRVTKFLGLEWHENQARFYEKNREKPIMSTTNYNNVTMPVYARSVGRWRVYEKHLAPALPVLEPFCKEFGYA